MGLFSSVLNKAVAVGKSLLGIAVDTIATAKHALAEVAKKKAIDPLARMKFERERSRCEARQKEIDAEILGILEQKRRDGGLSQEARDRREVLEREHDGIAQKLGPRKAVEMAPDDYDLVEVDPNHMHRLEWHVGQDTDKRCPDCGLPMILQVPRDQVQAAHPSYFWACTGYYLHQSDPRRCLCTASVTQNDLGTLLRRDNEALAMNREEMVRRAFDSRYKQRIGRDLRGLQGQVFSAYRCPLHGVGMVLREKKDPKGPLDVWYLKCPSPIPYNDGLGCGQKRKLKTVAQVLAVRQIGTGEIF